MKYCTHCGKELLDEAVVCVACGCPVQDMKNIVLKRQPTEQEIQRRKARSKKAIKITLAVICFAVAVYFISIPIINLKKASEINKKLDGKAFTYNDTTTYYALGAISSTRETYSFDGEGNCKKSHWYYNSYSDSKMDYGNDYTYKITFKNKTAYISRFI